MGRAVRFNKHFTSATMTDPATGLSARELIEIVDEKNNALEPKYRFEMRRDKLIHRVNIQNDARDTTTIHTIHHDTGDLRICSNNDKLLLCAKEDFYQRLLS